MKNRNKDEQIWFKGEIIPYEKAQINIMNATAQYGINVFEGIRCYYNKEDKELYAFKLQEHLKRLLISAKLLRFELQPNITTDYLEKAIKDVIKANNLQEDIYVKIGLFLDFDGSWGASNPIGIYILPFPKGRDFADKEGLECCISSWERINDSAIPPRVKAGANYINSRYALLEAKLNGYDYTILMNRNGKISEGPGACLFMLREGKLITPPVTASILESINRKAIIELAQEELNIQVQERDIDRSELYIAEEAFFVGTSIEIVPILSVDKYILECANSKTITNQLQDLYFKIVRNNYKKYNNWLTAIK